MLTISFTKITTFLSLMFFTFWWIEKIKLKTQKKKLLNRISLLSHELISTKETLKSNEKWHDQCIRLHNEIVVLRNTNTSLKVSLKEVSVRAQSSQEYQKQQMKNIVLNEKQLTERFENLANKIFETTSKKMGSQSFRGLNEVIAPFQKQLEIFQNQILNGFNIESQDRHILKKEIHDLHQLNIRMTDEANNLVQALKGSNKIQGDWGEMILTRVLEASGLREGYEYNTQVNYDKESCVRARPDVVIHLPKGKEVVVDSKVSLVSYERYFNAKDERTRQQALKEHVGSIKKHIMHLSKKEYEKIKGINSLDYILMFIPIEPALLLAINYNPDLIIQALKNNIMLVSPTTILVALRTITNLWKYEYQNRHAKKIALKASALYDKTRLFIEDMLSIGESIERSKSHYDQAIKKLTFGRSNLLSQIESFRHLGIDIKRDINSVLAKKAHQSSISSTDGVD